MKLPLWWIYSSVWPIEFVWKQEVTDDSLRQFLDRWWHCSSPLLNVLQWWKWIMFRTLCHVYEGIKPCWHVHLCPLAFKGYSSTCRTAMAECVCVCVCVCGCIYVCVCVCVCNQKYCNIVCWCENITRARHEEQNHKIVTL